ncbi:hypothetical protein I7K81_03670 [Neisseria meningitidis]|nr:hypothetical protein [Neisseria meningitidis]
MIYCSVFYKRKQIGGRPGKPAPNADGKYAYRWKTQPHPPPGVSDGTTAAGNVRRLRQRRTQKTVRLRLQQSDRYRRFFPNRLQVSPVRRVMPPPPFKGNARVNGFAVSRAAGCRRVS